MTNINARIINMNKNGKNTKIQATVSLPDLQIILSNHVQNKTYTIFKRKIATMLEVGQLYAPTQYT
jgi:hypothetical protein